MSRIVSAWLPRWPILRFLVAQARNNPKACNPLARERPIDPERPFVLTAEAAGGPRITAANEAAEALKIRVGDGLGDARAKAQFLQVEAADPESDAVALGHLTLWATRYAPAVSPFDEESGADGFFLDISGAAHLFGGEEKLIADLSHRLEQFGFERFRAFTAPCRRRYAGNGLGLFHFHPSSHIILPPSDIQASENQATESKAPGTLAVTAASSRRRGSRRFAHRGLAS